MKNLPEEVILEILVRLPVKSLMRFKCVSISWLSLISDPSFAKLHFQRSSSQHSQRILHIAGSQMQSIDINASLLDDSAIVKLDFPLFMPQFEILGSYRGLLLLSHPTEEKFFLWNPSTRVSNQILLPRAKFEYLYGFCYRESTDDYLLVLTTSHVGPSGGFVLGFEVFSMKSRSSEKLALSYHVIGGLRYYRRTIGSILKGAIHWLIWHLGTFEAKIIAFDITTKNLRELPTPNCANLDSNQCLLQSAAVLGVLGDCLFLTERKTDKIQIWVMREYGEKSSWTKFISLSFFGRETNFILPLCFTKNGELVATYDSIGLTKWNDKGELLEERQYCPRRYAIVYTESLFFPSLSVV